MSDKPKWEQHCPPTFLVRRRKRVSCEGIKNAKAKVVVLLFWCWIKSICIVCWNLLPRLEAGLLFIRWNFSTRKREKWRWLRACNACRMAMGDIIGELAASFLWLNVKNIISVGFISIVEYAKKNKKSTGLIVVDVDAKWRLFYNVEVWLVLEFFWCNLYRLTGDNLLYGRDLRRRLELRAAA